MTLEENLILTRARELHLRAELDQILAAKNGGIMKDAFITEADKQLAQDLANASQRPNADGGVQGLMAEDIEEELAEYRRVYAQMAVSSARADWERDLAEDLKGVEVALAQLRHLYAQMVGGQVKDTPAAARGLLAPQIVVLERVCAKVKKRTI